MLRNAAIAWVRSNCPQREVHRDFISSIDATIAQGANRSYLIGRSLTRQGAAYLLYAFAGELFVFQLTARQEAAVAIGPGEMRGEPNIAPPDDRPAPPPLLSLERLEVVTPIVSDPKRPIVCRCQYRLLRNPREPLDGVGPDSPARPGPRASFPARPHFDPGVPVAPGVYHSPNLGPPHFGPAAPGRVPVPRQGLPAQHGPQQQSPYQPPSPLGSAGAPSPSDFFPGTNYAFRLEHSVRHAKMRSLFTYPGLPLSSTGTLDLHFPPPGEGTLVEPLVVAFVSCCTRPDPNRGRQAVPLSNPVGALLDIEFPARFRT
jgi:hypothetical protein